MSRFFTICILLFGSMAQAQQHYSVSGQILDETGAAIPFATLILKSAIDSSMVKADVAGDDGSFRLDMVPGGKYYAEAAYVGLATTQTATFDLVSPLQLPTITLKSDAELLDEVVVTTQRSIIEVKADRKVFNVQGTINATGENGLNLLRKAPGVLVDNNSNISVLGRTGVLFYVDGKRVPLTGEELSNYLQSLSSDQIDKIEIITNPGSKYEAQGNAGIIDIRLKKDKNFGTNATVSATYGHGRYGQGNINTNGNYRNKFVNVFGGLGLYNGTRWNKIVFDTYQNGYKLDEINTMVHGYEGFDGRVGADIFVHRNHTLGFIVSGANNQTDMSNANYTKISDEDTPSVIDSILQAPNTSDATRKRSTFNVNYVFESGKNKVSIDGDYGRFRNNADNFQPNYYLAANEMDTLSRNITTYNTPVEIDIATAKADYETEFLGGSLGIGTKLSKVKTFNTFLFYNIIDGESVQNNRRSNRFRYDENVYAGYTNFARKLSDKWSASAGLRVEHTAARGDLIAFIPELEEAPVVFDYTSFFPSAGLTYTVNPEHVFSLNYGRRINRPDYNVLNPFKEQLSELSYSKGNAYLQPEIVNNIELGYTLKYRFSFTLAYSNTQNQITRLIGPDETDPRAGFISWDNLATQKLYSGNASLPFDVAKWWNAFVNLSVSYTDNQADYGDGKIVDVQAGSYNIFQQNTFDLGNKWKGEISGWYSGPGVWGGVFLYDPSYSLNLGIQRKFLNDRLNAKLSVSDVTYQSGWSGVSRFNGQVGYGYGNWDSRRATVTLSYDFGNKNVKPRKRKTGIEEESKRVAG